MPVMTECRKQYFHNLLEELFQIREQACDGFIGPGAELDQLSDNAIDIVFEIMWSQAHWAIRNRLGVPMKKVRAETIDEQRITLMKWLELFAESSSLYPNAVPLQKIAREEINHLSLVRLGRPHRYGEVSEKGEKGLADAKITAFHRILLETNMLVREGISERQARKLAIQAIDGTSQDFSKWKSRIERLYPDDIGLRHLGRGKGGKKGEPRRADPLIQTPHLIPLKEIRDTVEHGVDDGKIPIPQSVQDSSTIIQAIIRLLFAAADWRELSISKDHAENAKSAKRLK